MFQYTTDFNVDFDYSGLTDLYILFKIAELNNIPFYFFQKDINSIWEALLAEFITVSREDSIHLIDGAKQVIQRFSYSDNVVLGLVTGNFRSCAYLKLSIVGLDKFFPFGAFGDESVDRADLPRIALQRARSITNIEFSPNDTIVVGDSALDIQSAKKNGLKSVAVATGQTKSETLAKENPDLLVPNLLDVNMLEEFVLQ